MSTAPVVILLAFNGLLLIGAHFLFDKARRHRDTILFSLLFLCSGMPVLIYQIVWQRVLFSIYGVNSQSVVIVVTAFMVGLGIGSLAGGRLSARFPRRAVLIFGIAELGVAAFGLSSLRIFHWAATHTAGANLPSVILFSLVLLLIPTILMGATLPLLVEHLVLHTKRVGASVSTLYFANTFGSAIACYLCATFLLRDFGQSGSVSIAACLNAVVGGAAYLYARRDKQSLGEKTRAIPRLETESTPVSLPAAMLLAGMSGFIALGFEIAWFRVFALASSDRAPAFALLLSTYLAGIAAGCYLSERGTAQRKPEAVMRVVGILLILAGAISAYLPPLVAAFMFRNIPFLASAPVFFVTTALIGSVLPLLCRVAIPPDDKAGRSVSFVYVSNIIGSALGSLGIEFFLMCSTWVCDLCRSDWECWPYCWAPRFSFSTKAKWGCRRYGPWRPEILGSGILRFPSNAPRKAPDHHGRQHGPGVERQFHSSVALIMSAFLLPTERRSQGFAAAADQPEEHLKVRTCLRYNDTPAGKYHALQMLRSEKFPILELRVAGVSRWENSETLNRKQGVITY